MFKRGINYILISFLFSNIGYSQDKNKTDFYVKTVGHFCYSNYDDAWSEAQRIAETKAQNICKGKVALRVTDYFRVDSASYCSVAFMAGFTCRQRR